MRINRKGWYPDPADPNRQLFWDGHRWSRESHNLPPTTTELDAGTSEDVGVSRWKAPLLSSIISVSRAFGRILLRAARRLNRYPLWLKISASMVALSLISAAIIGGVLYSGAANQTPLTAMVKSDPKDQLRAEMRCLNDTGDLYPDASSGFKDVRRSPSDGRHKEQWDAYVTEGMQDMSAAQAGSVLQLFGLIYEDGIPEYREKSYIGFGSLDVTNADGSYDYFLWMCGVVLDRVYAGQEESVVFTLG
jgi:hypothetical protein